jgi:NAD(P) transhydrogenase subunit alpha
VVAHGVTIVGAVNLASAAPYHASQLYARTIVALFLHLLKDGAIGIDLTDEITRETLVTRGGEIVHPRVGKEA